MAKKLYEVKVVGTAVEYYEVEATSEEDALERWNNGELTGTDNYGFEPVEAREYFEDDDYEEDYDAVNDDQYV